MRVRGSTDCINFKAVALILKRPALELTRCARVNFKARVKETCIEFSSIYCVRALLRAAKYVGFVRGGGGANETGYEHKIYF